MKSLDYHFDGEQFGRYRVVKRIGMGGMATVHLAFLEGSQGFEKWVAIKIIHPELAEDSYFSSRFLDEAKLASRIAHSNVCSVLDFGIQDTIPYIVLEYLRGKQFSAVLREGWSKGSLPWELSARVLADAARGLHAAHELQDEAHQPLGLVHRDISPQNLMVLFEGATKVLDFGVARAQSNMAVSMMGQVKGRIAYMAPEQLQSLPIDRRSDIWSLGVLLWEATLGKRLFLKDDAPQTAHAVLQQPIIEPTQINPDYPPELNDVVMAALQRNAAERTPSAQKLAENLESFLYAQGKPFGATQVSQWMQANFEASDDPIASVASLRQSLPASNTLSPTEQRSGEQPSTNTAALPKGSNDKSSTAARRLGWQLSVLLLFGIALGLMWKIAVSSNSSVPSTRQTTSARSVSRYNRNSVEHNPSEATQQAQQRSAQTNEKPQIGGSQVGTKPTATRSPVPTKLAKTRKPLTQNSLDTTGSINLLAIPAAEVSLDGKVIGTTPLIEYPLPAGKHILQVQASNGQTERLVVHVVAGQNTKKTIRLQPTVP